MCSSLNATKNVIIPINDACENILEFLCNLVLT